MSLQKLASLGRTLASRSLLPTSAKSRVTPSRQMGKILAIAPENPCSKTELTIMGVILSVSILFIPGWIVFHINDYTKPARLANQ